MLRVLFVTLDDADNPVQGRVRGIDSILNSLGVPPQFSQEYILKNQTQTEGDYRRDKQMIDRKLFLLGFANSMVFRREVLD